MQHGHSIPGVVTGKPVEIGGSLGRVEATGRGVQFIVQEACRERGLDLNGATIAIQGFGNVGGVAARLLKRSRREDRRRQRLTQRRLQRRRPRRRCAVRASRRRRHSRRAPSTPPRPHERRAARAAGRHPHPGRARGPDHRAQRRKHPAPIVIEAANGPTTSAADAILAQRGVYLVPDILANAGGVIVSYFEWVQDLQSFFWEENEVNDRLRRIIVKAFGEVTTLAKEQDLRLREAAYVVALRRVVAAINLRGIHP